MSAQQQKYEVNQYTVDSILAWVDAGDIAIPEIQRPFVWEKARVRSLIDSLYKGFPIGYLIVWKNPDVTLKDGTKSLGKKILIDGQQRVTSLAAALLGREITNKRYTKERIRIAFNPAREEFAVQNPAIEKDDSWIPDIAPIMSGKKSVFAALDEYCRKNGGADREKMGRAIENLCGIRAKTLGLIELGQYLDIDAVTTIFERINSEGVRLSKADFAMSKIASYGEFGSNLRKLIDFFCHLAAAPEFYPQLENISDALSPKHLGAIRWLKDETDDLYDPTYSDVLRVALVGGFGRGKMGDLVSMLSGRNFETREFEVQIQEDAFERLEETILRFANEHNFTKFTMIVRSAGFVSPDMIRGTGALNFAYAAYLKLRELGTPQNEIEPFVRRWFVMSLLTSRYSASPETVFDSDIKRIAEDPHKHLRYVEDSELSDAFWNTKLVGELETSSRTSQSLYVFFASQIKAASKGFLSTDITVRDMSAGDGEIHHIFPKAYVKKTHNNRRDYNQIANLVYMQSEINKAVGDKPPSEYFGKVLAQCRGGPRKFGGISDMESLRSNMEQNCIPESAFEMSIGDYHDFLGQRRMLMAGAIRRYYEGLR